MLWGISYSNFVMLQATIPVYESDDDEKKGDSEHEGIEDLAKHLNL